MNSLRWGLLSTARINRRLLSAIEKSERSTVLAVASRDQDRAIDYASERGIPKAFGSYEALLADPEIDVVYVPLPNQLHAPWTVRALKAGKHVMCEKPLALSAVQVDVMVRAARKADRVLAEAFMYRHHLRTRTVRQWVNEGRIGELRAMNGAFSFRFDRGDNYRWDPSQGGGALWDVGCYPVSFARYIAGQEPDRVEALAVDFDSDIDITMAGVLRFPSGVVATFDCGFDAVFRSEMTVVGTEGVIHVPMAFQAVGSVPLILRNAEGEEQSEMIEDFEPAFLGEVRDMERVILDGGEQEISWGESRGNASTLHALMDSARSGHAERPG